MADPITDLQVVSAPLQRGGLFTAYREKNLPMKMMIGSVIFFVFLGFYRRRYSGSGPTVAVETGETLQEKM